MGPISSPSRVQDADPGAKLLLALTAPILPDREPVPPCLSCCLRQGVGADLSPPTNYYLHIGSRPSRLLAKNQARSWGGFLSDKPAIMGWVVVARAVISLAVLARVANAQGQQAPADNPSEALNTELRTEVSARTLILGIIWLLPC